MRNLFSLSLWVIWSFFIHGSSQQEHIASLRIFDCATGNQTIPYANFCNGVKDCDDGSDENYHAFSRNALTEWQSCINFENDYARSCSVKRNKICRGHFRCSNINPCDVKCDSHYLCNSGECIRRSTVCNEIPCDGCLEDHGWSNGHGFKCLRNGIECVLPQQLLHDDVSDCDGGSDICFGYEVLLNASSRNEFQNSNNLFKDRCFECLKDGLIIPTSRVCDGVIDCSDLSDECLCEGKQPEICGKVVKYGQQVLDTNERKYENFGSGGQYPTPVWNNSRGCSFGEVQCENGKCIPRSYICNGVKDCEDDERFDYCRGTINCKDATRYEKKCRCAIEKPDCHTAYGTACNGVMDCFEPEPKGKIVAGELNTFPEDECKASCRGNQTWHYNCTKNLVSVVSIPLEMFLCDPDSSTDTASYENTKECDGIKHCDSGIDERDCPERYVCDTVKPALVSIDIDQVCNGVRDCKDGSDETKDMCGQNRFQCLALGGKMVNIDSESVCDFIVNCDDGSDEMDCDDGRFFCENEEPLFVSERQKFDGRGDCTDWSDECPLLDKSYSTDSFSSRYEMIGNPVLRALVWIVGLLSIAGNAAVLYTELKNLRNISNISAIATANRILIINLAFSDLIMGVYLIAIGIAGISMQGMYCSQDLVWRSSSACTALGVLSVLSSETSVITMILLTGCRLYAVFEPFKSSSRPRKRVVGLMIFSSWSFALTIALLPLSSGLSSTFVTHAQFQHSPYFKNLRTPLDSARNLFQDLMTYDIRYNMTIPDGFNPSILSWDELWTYSDEFFIREHFHPQRYFGYYSSHSVCLPKFFPSRSDPGWGFSFFVNLFNFCAFVFVASSYIVIYTNSRKRSRIRSSTRANKDKVTMVLQRKILRLIITDFCCWIPICIIAFAKLGGAEVSNTAYAFAAIVLLPINSALNPLLYSSLLDILYQKVTSKLKKDQSASSELTTPGTDNTGFQMSDTKSVVIKEVSKNESDDTKI